MTADPFNDKLAEWRAWTEAPWGRIRFAVVEETLRRETEQLGTKLRILDVGGGDGGDAIPLARAGHDVTILDPAPAWLEEAERRAAEAGVTITTRQGSLDDLAAYTDFDLVLCHFVLHYRGDDDAGDLRRLAGTLRDKGTLSIMAPNPDAMVLFKLTREGPAAALEELQKETVHAKTFDHQARKLRADDIAAVAATQGLTEHKRYAARTANDLIVYDDKKLDPAYFDDLLALELALCDREPYTRIGGMWQLVLTRG